MTGNPSNKSVFITGCSSGIGRVTALHLARHGFTVFASVRREEHSEELRRLDEPNLIPVCPLDLARTTDIPEVQKTVVHELQRRGQSGLYALINNAGGGAVAPVELLNLETFQQELRTRVVGSVGLVQAFLPLLREGAGRIVWIMTPAIIPTPYVAAIHACDFAASCVARTLEIELKPWNIPNIQIRCGGIKTPAGLRTSADVAGLLQRVPLDRAALYERQLRAWAAEMEQFDARRTDAHEVADVVARALRALSPKRRYSVGHMSRAAALLELLPQRLADRILRSRF